MTANPTGFFSGTNTPPEAETTNALIDSLNAQVATVTAANSQAQAAATAAEASASNASISETNVSTLAQQATNTLNSANTTLAQAQTAVSTANSAVTQATTQAGIATTQAGAASTSATNAAASETNAAGSATAASSSASAASTSASNAAGSATAAANSASSASTQASNAASSATAASTSASSASTSAGNASNSASSASTYASNASTSASQAAGSASAASTSASNAASSATASSTSATNAQNSANAAAASAASITLPIPISSGGTGHTDAASSLSALGGVNAAYVAAAVAPFSGRNRIINGDCRVAQRSTLTLAGTAGTSIQGYGGPDRYLCINSAGGTVQQSQGTMAYNGVTHPCVTQSCTANMVDNSTNKFWGGILQCIEGLNAFDLIGQPVALRFLYQSSAIGNHTVAVRDGAGTYSFVTNISVATANTPQMYTVLLPAIPAGASIASSTVVGMYVSVGALSAGNYKTSTLGAWQSGNYFTSGTAVNWATSGNSISLTLLQLEAGSVATPFERRSYGQELALCQRYYQLSLVNVACQAVNGTGNLQTAVTFPSMRAAPTVTLSGGTYNNTSAIYASGATTSGVSVGATVTATGEAALSSWTVTLSSEL